MNLECILRRQGGTKVDLDGIQYHFSPLDDGAHVAEVARTDHIDRFLAIPEAYKVYHGALQALTKPVELAVEAVAIKSEPAEGQYLGLLGGVDHLPSYDIGGVTYALGDIVRKAYEASQLSYDDWNELHEDDRSARIDMMLDDLAEAAEKAPAVPETNSTPADGTPEPTTRDGWVALYLAKFGKPPHHKASIETIKKALAEA